MLRTRKEWEVEKWIDTAEVFYAPGTKGYRIAELTSGYRYHVDIEYRPRSNSRSMYRTFILCRAEDLLALLQEDKEVLDIRISLQSAFSMAENYVISRVIRIYTALDNENNLFTVFQCSDGKTYAGRETNQDLASLTEVQEVWPFSKKG